MKSNIEIRDVVTQIWCYLVLKCKYPKQVLQFDSDYSTVPAVPGLIQTL